MEIVKFKDQTWQEIPDHQNPAMMKNGFGETEECIMICKDNRQRVNANSFLVIHVQPDTDITQKGCFWKFEDAELFASAFKVFLVKLNLELATLESDDKLKGEE